MAASTPDSRVRLPLAAILFVIALGGAVDLILDAPERWLSVHVAYELLLIVGALATSAWLWHGWRRVERENADLRRLVTERQAERDAWRASAQNALEGLAVAIGGQLDRWGLTPAEREVAILVLKGQSHKQIAAGTGRSERTVRQHAAAAYAKAGLGGRAELAAFFLEDLPLSPRKS
ncbi:MAG TPA: LuxR C-terminal-related transcriptional regulator [Gemmatimonadales bacterium]|nr:LuxR C-terminal-related transcriptional regulator [Gemmatimonadales bacterium]